MKARSRHGIALALCCLGIAAAPASDETIIAGQSSIVATFKQDHAPVEAAFKKFSGSVDYDATKAAATSASLSVDTASLDVGDEDTDAEVRKPAWFDSAHFPQATFRATSIKPGASGHFEATGPLSIKGKTLTVTVTVSVQRSGTANAFDGTFEISRKAFGIGDPIWEGALDDTVRVHFHLLVAAG